MTRSKQQIDANQFAFSAGQLLGSLIVFLLIACLIGFPIFYFGKRIPVGLTYNQEFRRPLEFAVSATLPIEVAERFEKAAGYLDRHNLSDRDLCLYQYSDICDTALFYDKLLENASQMRQISDASLEAQALVMTRMRESFVTHTDDGGEVIGIPHRIVGTIAFGLVTSEIFKWIMIGDFIFLVILLCACGSGPPSLSPL